MGKLEDIQNRPRTLKGVKKTPTMLVRRIADNARCTIDSITYDSSRYQKLDKDEVIAVRTSEERAAEKAAALAAEEAAKEAVVNSPYSRDELARLGKEALHELPEWKRAPQGRKRKCQDDKDEQIKLILAMRVS